nr:HAD hydrolase-like protein [Pelagibius marinus]
MDNTLYDWVGFFVPSFYAMVDKAVEIIGCDRDALLDDLKAVHQRHHDSEHPFSLLETSIVRERFTGKSMDEVARLLDPAFHAYNSTRKKTLKLHPGIPEALDQLNRSGVRVVAHTESKLYAIVSRFRLLGLTNSFSRIYCRERSISQHLGVGTDDKFLEDFPMNRVVELSKHQTKPNVDVLLEICSREGVRPSSSAYVGDSMARDMLMAKQAGVFAIWAAYGAKHDPKEYNKLVRISHWTTEDVRREKSLKLAAEQVRPDFVARGSFSEVLPVILLGNNGSRDVHSDARASHSR